MHSYWFGYATCEMMSIVFGTPFVCAHTYAHFYIPHLATVIRPISLAKLHQATISNSILFTEFPPTREIEGDRGRERKNICYHMKCWWNSLENRVFLCWEVKRIMHTQNIDLNTCVLYLQPSYFICKSTQTQTGCQNIFVRLWHSLRNAILFSNIFCIFFAYKNCTRYKHLFYCAACFWTVYSVEFQHSAGFEHYW